MISAQREHTHDYWLGLTMSQEREAQDILVSEVAGRARCAEITVRNFENGKTRPREIDQLLSAYAELLDVEDPLTFYELTLQRWRSG